MIGVTGTMPGVTVPVLVGVRVVVGSSVLVGSFVSGGSVGGCDVFVGGGVDGVFVGGGVAEGVDVNVGVVVQVDSGVGVSRGVGSWRIGYGCGDSPIRPIDEMTTKAENK